MNIETTPTQLQVRPDALLIQWAGGATSEYPSLWLRDNCPGDRDPANGQRLVDVADLPARPRIRTASLSGKLVEVRFEDLESPACFEVEWLARHAPGQPDAEHRFPPRTWLHGAEMDAKSEFAWIAFEAARRDPARRLDWTVGLLRDGIAFMEGVPCRKGAILDVGALIGRVLETNYGTTFDVRSVAQPENLAYSDLGLGLHTDNPYREPVPGFQALHVIQAAPDGGVSLFGDGFALAQQLREENPQAFEILTRTPVPFLYRSRDAELYAERPLIQLAADGSLRAVHYNNRSIAPLPLPPAQLAAFYDAYRAFALLLRESRYQLRLLLGDGQLVIFDNQRTLHGRTAFASARHPRHLEGCYLSRDSVYSGAGLLRRQA